MLSLQLKIKVFLLCFLSIQIWQSQDRETSIKHMPYYWWHDRSSSLACLWTRGGLGHKDQQRTNSFITLSFVLLTNPPLDARWSSTRKQTAKSLHFVTFSVLFTSLACLLHEMGFAEKTHNNSLHFVNLQVFVFFTSPPLYARWASTRRLTTNYQHLIAI